MKDEQKKDDLRVCTKCGDPKDLSQFGVNRRYLDGVSRTCKTCNSSRVKGWYHENQEKALAQKRKYTESHKEEIAARNKGWRRKNLVHVRALHRQRHQVHREEDNVAARRYYREHRDALLVQSKDYRDSHKEQRKMYGREYALKNGENLREYRNTYHYERRTDEMYRLPRLIRGRLNKALKGNAKTGSAVRDLGCSIPELKVHLEQQFQPGMSWENWGSGLGDWSIDHIKCLAAFDLRDPGQFKEACNFRNLRPLWHVENLSRPKPRRGKTPTAVVV
jgi:hypothetical protein